MLLYIVRHGETDWNKSHRVQGRTDIPLNDYGRRLAEETAEGDKVVLNAQISQGTAVGPTGYTEESYSRLQEALEAANIASADRWASQELIDECANAVKQAVQGLEEK